MNPILVTDQTILAFFEKNPNIDSTTMFRIFINILENLSTNLNETLSNNINNQILTTLQDISKDINGLKSNIVSQLQETKKEYIENVKLILDNNSFTSSEKIQHILEKNSDTIIVKTNSMINEVIPKHNTQLSSFIETSIKGICDSVNQDTSKLIDNMNKDENHIHEFISTIDDKFNKMILGLQQPIFSYIQSSEERTSNNVQQIRDKIINQQTSQENLNGVLHEFLNKYKHNSSSKGNVSEIQLYSILQQIFPSDEIIDCSGETATCDYKVNRLYPDKPSILFENKDYSRSVTTDEIKKFERDLKQQKLHGIFISQTSNITYKEPFQIDIIDGLIHIYIPNTQYNMEKIKIAVEIIDTLSKKLKYMNTAKNEITTINITKEDLTDLVEMFNEFTEQKQSIIETAKSSHKILLDKIDNMQMNSVKKLLFKNGILQNDDDFKCKNCNSFTGKNKASLGAHIRNCKANPNNVVTIDNIKKT